MTHTVHDTLRLSNYALLTENHYACPRCGTEHELNPGAVAQCKCNFKLSRRPNDVLIIEGVVKGKDKGPKTGNKR